MNEPGAEPEKSDRLPAFGRKAIYFGLLFEGGLGLVALLLGWLFRQPPLAAVKFDLAGIGFGIAATLPMLAGFVLAIWLPVPRFQRLLRVFDEFGRPFFAAYTVLDLAVLSLAALSSRFAASSVKVEPYISGNEVTSKIIASIPSTAPVNHLPPRPVSGASPFMFTWSL